MIRSSVVGACLLGTALFAHAQVRPLPAPVQATGFAVSGAYSVGLAATPILLSDAGGVAEFAFAGNYASLSAAYTSRNYTSLGSFNWYMDEMVQAFAFHVQDGYRITGIEFSGIGDGRFAHSDLPSYMGTVLTPGSASSTMGLRVDVGAQSDIDRLNNATAPTAFEASLTGLDLQGDFNARLTFDWRMDRTPTTFQSCTDYGGGYRLCNQGYQYTDTPSIRYGDMRMTVHTAAIAAPVPEPETYALMLAGLGVMGAVVRRRRKTQA